MTPILRTAIVFLAALHLKSPLVLADVPPPLAETRIVSTYDDTEQPVGFWIPELAREQATPVLILLHTWSSDYTQDRSPWYDEARSRGWIYLQPNFRGPNNKPEACGSPAAQQDILDAIDWAVQELKVDTHRIYLAGVSGGGHMSLLMAAQHPERFSAVTAWVGITDLGDWYRFHTSEGGPDKYARMVAASCGGPPGVSEDIDREYHARSPLNFLQGAVGLPLDINTGVNDGKTGSVPIHHSLRAFNVVAQAGGRPVIPEAMMEELWQNGRLSTPQPGDEIDDPTYEKAILLRRTAGSARLTIFDGGHEALPSAACAWLAEQSRFVKSAAR